MKHVGMRSWDGKNVVLTYWETESPKAVVQILHGMSEHMGRYDAFANYLVTRGYAVVGDDHRAHGITDSDALGISPAGGDLFADTVRDEAELTARIKKITGLPVLMF